MKKLVAFNFLGNPAAKYYSWQLNRAWLLAAVHLGFQFRLVEQHFPEIEAALLSGDPVRFIEQFAKEIRTNNQISQYNGDYSPTAAPQEILFLLDIGCVAKKDEKGGITFHPPHKNSRRIQFSE